jgi:hypothetical protein
MSPAPKVGSRLDTLDAWDDACAASAPVFVSCVFDAVRERHDEVLLNLSAPAGQLGSMTTSASAGSVSRQVSIIPKRGWGELTRLSVNCHPHMCFGDVRV